MRAMLRAALLLVVGMAWVSAAAGGILFSQSGVTPPERRGGPNVWLFTSVAADYDGAIMLPHWIKHYTGLGIARSRFLVIVNSNVEKYPGGEGLREVKAILDGEHIRYKLYLEQYSSEKLYSLRLGIMAQVPVEDWIVHADSDEFHDFGVPSVVDYLADMDKRGVNEVRGYYTDRVARGGVLRKIEAAPSWQEQFPLKCQVIKNVAKGRDNKAMAYRGYWRTDRGNHQVIRPPRAKDYFSGSPPDVLSARGVYGAEEVYHLTPYAKHPEKYAYKCGGPDRNPDGSLLVTLPKGISCDKVEGKGKGGKSSHWSPERSASSKVTVNHVKWHEGVIANIRDRLVYYKGDKDSTGKARYNWYQDSEKLMKGIVDNGRIDLKLTGCKG
mmetsp:Transcript_65786/g.208213  ORF Transcript_65786/g.208213 Transcript_65786/m.208213 type:complete len:383 (-) Transcript_65786:38-1186(-)